MGRVERSRCRQADSPEKVEPPRTGIPDQVRRQASVQPLHAPLFDNLSESPPDLVQSSARLLRRRDLQLDFEEVERLHADGRDDAGRDAAEGAVERGGAEYGRGRVGRHGALGRETSSCLRGAAGVEERVGGGVDTLRIRPQSPGWLCGRERVAR